MCRVLVVTDETHRGRFRRDCIAECFDWRLNVCETLEYLRVEPDQVRCLVVE